MNPEEKSFFEEVDPVYDQIAQQVVDCAFKVHSSLGPGLMEHVYEACLAYELSARGLKVEQQVGIPLNHGEVKLNVGFRLDLLVEKKLIVEIKSIEELLPIHHAQVLTYLKLSGHSLGLLINFNSRWIKDGLKRVALSKKKEK
jgi:GxxExxY protein